MALQIHTATHLDSLFDALCAVVAAAPAPALGDETIVVGSKGMDRWLEQRWAQRFGVAAGLRFPFPGRFVEDMLATAAADHAATNVWDPALLPWAIAARLPPLTQRDPVRFARVARYLRDATGDPVDRLLHLARDVARAFERVDVARGDDAAQAAFWEHGSDGPWLGALWRDMAAIPGALPLWPRLRRFAAALPKLPASLLPVRVNVFGVATLPRPYAELFALLAQRSDVHLYVTALSGEYFATDVRRRRGAVALGAHPLLERGGRLGGDFQDQLAALIEAHAAVVAIDERNHDRPAATPPATLLARVQADLRAARAPELAGPFVPPAGDASLRVHVCHSRTRELEVLRDELLRALRDLPNLAPHEMAVMMPDVDATAPLIHAVFGGVAALPYRIADRASRADQPAVDAWLQLLALLNGRCGASEVLDWLALPAPARRYGIDDDGLTLLRAWLSTMGVRWGLDETQRRDCHGAPTHAFSWAAGLDRLWLGLACGNDDEDGVFGTTAPWAEAVAAPALVGALARAIADLRGARNEAAQPRAAAAWEAQLHGWIDGFLEGGDADDAADRRDLHAAVAAVCGHAATAGFTTPLALATLVPWLEAALTAASPAWNFLAGGVTFCALTPLRSVPFRVVALVGMDDGAWPRQDTRGDLDPLPWQEVRAGDPSRRDEDRYVFLEALLAAGERVIVTATGRDIRDQSLQPPAVCVAELLDTCERTAPGSSAHIVVDHALHPFDPRYFGGDDRAPLPRSHDHDWLAAARATRAPRQAAAAFAATVALPTLPTQLDLHAFLRFWRNPARAWLRRLGVALDDRAFVLSDREPLGVDDRTRADIGRALLRAHVAGGDATARQRYLRAAVPLPLGGPGDAACTNIASAVAALMATARAHGLGALHADECRAVVVGDVTLAATFDCDDRGTPWWIEFGRVNAARRLEACLRHLWWQAAAPAGPAPTVALLRGDADVPALYVWPSGPERAQALDQLRGMLDAWRSGAAKPLPFMPDVSLAYAASRARGEDDGTAWRAARAAFSARGGPNRDPSLLQAWGDDALAAWQQAADPSFADLAALVFAPLLAAEARI